MSSNGLFKTNAITGQNTITLNQQSNCSVQHSVCEGSEKDWEQQS
jgi:hypothetical protein